MTKNKVVIGFLGNINFDTRSFNLFKSLKDKNHNVKFYGFDWLTPDFEQIKTGDIRVTKLVKNKFSLLFYIKFSLILFLQLLKTKADIYFASDFYALPFCSIVAKLKRRKVFYDSREVYTGLPALNNKPIVKKLFKQIEGLFIKRCDYIVTTGELDSRFIEDLYNLPEIDVLRNLPLPVEKLNPVDFKSKFENYNGGKILLYQGIVVLGRGIETYFKVLEKYENSYLVILGGGEDLEYYKNLASESGIIDRIYFAGKVPQTELLNYTAGADVGLSLIDNISQNNLYALPNKLFEYLMAEIPVIASDLPQMKEVVEKYEVGAVLPEGNEDEIIKLLKFWDENPAEYEKLKYKCKPASEVLNWNNEFEKIYDKFN